MNHPEGQDEINRFFNPDIVLRYENRSDTGGHTCLFRTLAHSIEHLLLKVHGNNGPFVAYHLRHGDRKISQTASDISDLHSFPDKRAEQSLRIVQETTERIVE